jgi:hypothetical protein
LKTLENYGYNSPIQYGTAYETTSHKKFTYNKESDTYTCQNNKELCFTHLSKTNGQLYYKTYSTKTKDCKVCPFREQCFGKTATKRTISSPIAHELTRIILFSLNKKLIIGTKCPTQK